MFECKQRWPKWLHESLKLAGCLASSLFDWLPLVLGFICLISFGGLLALAKKKIQKQWPTIWYKADKKSM